MAISIDSLLCAMKGRLRTSSQMIYRNLKRHNAGFCNLIGTLTFGDDKKMPQLQAADMMAAIARDMAMEHRRQGVTSYDDGPLDPAFISCVIEVRRTYWIFLSISCGRQQPNMQAPAPH
jgi:hypothetical protein